MTVTVENIKRYLWTDLATPWGVKEATGGAAWFIKICHVLASCFGECMDLSFMTAIDSQKGWQSSSWPCM